MAEMARTFGRVKTQGGGRWNDQASCSSHREFDSSGIQADLERFFKEVVDDRSTEFTGVGKLSPQHPLRVVERSV